MIAYRRQEPTSFHQPRKLRILRSTGRPKQLRPLTPEEMDHVTGLVMEQYRPAIAATIFAESPLLKFLRERAR